MQPHDVEKKKPVIRHEEVTVPRYTFVDKKKEIVTINEIPLDAIGRKEVEAFIGSLKDELAKLQEIVKGLVNYKIVEETVKSKNVIIEDLIVKNAVPQDVKVKNVILEDVKVKNPILQDVAVPCVSQKDIDALNLYKRVADDLFDKLKQIKDYKIEEVKRYTDIVVPKKVEVKSEKVVLHVKDEIIETIEDLLEHLKKVK